ncbi:SAM-dependent methyltransferase [Microvirga mediterraneensis]|uniref:Class I SAM-dependent methyltransferase n=1 Tax=Microvirga mediterraneensis TaxID=2754695 RepID=A0A838BHC8_9HYPH|nr:class I SAM-dependent methyltransferase [Microvirga mediterraneensis]MBA1154914.1 class I SAM-dependent methyltransferase [Microvirga mediterraneensis]
MLWRAYALLSHGGDRIGLGSIGLPSWHGPAAPSFQRTGDVLKVLEEADTAIWSASALSACAETGLLAHLGKPATIDTLAQAVSLSPALVRTLVDVLASHRFVVWDQDRVQAAPSLLPFTTPEGAETFRAFLRAPLLQADSFRHKLADHTLTLDGWTHTDEAIIESQGTLTRLWTTRALPKLKFLPGLVPRLEKPGAALLDVGAGAAGLSIALCRNFPHLSAVALEPAPQPARIGERHVREAGLEGRIVMRRQRAEDLDDERAFDLVFLPQMFLPDAIIQDAIERIFRSLRPGGWLLVAVLSQEGGGTASAVNRLKNLLWGGNTRAVNHLRPRLAAAGFDPVIRAPGRHALRMICARRPNLRDPS